MLINLGKAFSIHSLMADIRRISSSTVSDLPLDEIKLLLNLCYPLPPQDVYEKVSSSFKSIKPVWISYVDGDLVGMVMLSPHSKGGHLENLAVKPDFQNMGIGYQLVNQLLLDTSSRGGSLISLTTRIPKFFERFGFYKCGSLADGSLAMVHILQPATSTA